jgi:hypothetical protein
MNQGVAGAPSDLVRMPYQGIGKIRSNITAQPVIVLKQASFNLVSLSELSS